MLSSIASTARNNEIAAAVSCVTYAAAAAEATMNDASAAVATTSATAVRVTLEPAAATIPHTADANKQSFGGTTPSSRIETGRGKRRNTSS